MLRFLLRRVFYAFPTVLGSLVLVFIFLRLVPGDPVALALGEYADAQAISELRKVWGLDQGIFTQLLQYFLRLLRFDFGVSLSRNQPVFQLLTQALPSTLFLALPSLLLSLVFSITCVSFEYLNSSKKWIHWILQTIVWISGAIPLFVFAPLMILLFSVRWRLTPVSGDFDVSGYILPLSCLSFLLSGIFLRVLRASVADQNSALYVLAAKARGLTTLKIFWFHILKNSAVPLVIYSAQSLGALLSGAVLTETIFEWPGLGRLLYAGFQSRDYPLVQGIIIWISAVHIFSGILSDFLVALFDKRTEGEFL